MQLRTPCLNFVASAVEKPFEYLPTNFFEIFNVKVSFYVYGEKHFLALFENYCEGKSWAVPICLKA